ncbi:MAG: hypothetical protein DDT19_00767 [Syntrophomonadaceae bacterium]|nr:hypothetical protein [Bacillota bacterium]
MRLTLFEIDVMYSNKDFSNVTFNHTPMTWENFKRVIRTLPAETKTEATVSANKELIIITV